jgi:S-adenosylmethionine:tRNA ribosyltransferase-isomerase
MQLSDFDFNLPDELIAHHPPKNRADAKLLIGSTLQGEVFSNIINYLDKDDVLVLNDTKVLPARLFAYKTTGGKLEVLLDRISDTHHAIAMIKASRAPQVGSTIIFNDKSSAKILARDGAFYHLQFDNNIFELTANSGHIPLPPYIKREANTNDKERYQSVFAKNLGAVAAPTASLHFDDNLLATIAQKGVQIAYLTLHVGSGTFLPVKTDDVSKHQMHSEYFEMSPQTLAQIQNSKQQGGKVIAVGTTVVRVLETIAQNNYQQLSGETNIFIYPGFEFKVVDRLITNFHLPKSTLLMLVSALSGKQTIDTIYQHAIAQRYRFFSYGDAMLLDKK